jgi:hypothetical protein
MVKPPSVAATADLEFPLSIAQGPLWVEFRESDETSVTLNAVLCPLGRAFIDKGKIGKHYRSISRNGLVLLMSRHSVEELENAAIRVRFSIWHQSHLRGERATPRGILLCANIPEAASREGDQMGDFMRTVVARESVAEAALSIDLGAQRSLNFLSRA